jgi:hypothetical protein
MAKGNHRDKQRAREKEAARQAARAKSASSFTAPGTDWKKVAIVIFLTLMVLAPIIAIAVSTTSQ